MSIKNIAILIMAAGNSSRMGTPKQLLDWGNATLIEEVITKTLQLNTSKTIVVLGANNDKIISKIKPYPIEIILNVEWDKGLGNSIAFGAKYLQKNYQMDAVLVVLADQPLIKASYLKGIIDSFKTGEDQIIATQYNNGNLGVPALFDRCYFEELSNIDGDKGAKYLLNKHSDLVITTKLATNVFDIDTDEDYKKLYDANHQ